MIKSNDENKNIQDEKKNVNIIALKGPTSLGLVRLWNDSDENKKIAIVNGRVDRPESMNVYRITGASIPTDGELKVIKSSGVTNGSAGVIYLTIPANGFLVISDKPV